MDSSVDSQFVATLVACIILNVGCLQENWYGYHIRDPSEWGKMYARCADNHDQSPIKIEEAETVYDRVLSAPVLHGGWEYVPTSVLMLENNGHTMELVFKDNHIRMHGAHLTHEFYLKQCHFHWGEDIEKPGSEHWLNGKQYDAEMHCVFINVDFVPGTEEEIYDREAWAVFAVFIKFDSEKPNEYIDYLLSHTDAIREAGHNYSFNQEKKKADIRHLLPDNLSEYYRYQGSLTSPPCYEFVVWTIFNNPIHISRDQAEKLFELHNFVKERNVGYMNITGNFRPPQPLAGRTVYRSFRDIDDKLNTAYDQLSNGLVILFTLFAALFCARD
ncbi:carbonic anhydrase 13-like [Symsagittifera roscoffensis]|uniref:carbonic anhydrase 13-like n=1 Tax=Symsagittifera roscoffensis TaxID=84072 RepID=UPI00307B2AA1